MSDFTLIELEFNTGTDTSQTWSSSGSGNSVQFGGSAGLNELRWGSGNGSTGSASWVYITRPGSGTATVSQLWAYLTSDTSGGVQVSSYAGNGVTGFNNILRWHWDNTGTYAAAPQFSAFADTNHTNPSAGTQPPGTHNDAITNGQSSDTSSTSYLKYNAYGYGVDTGGTQQSPPNSGNVGTTCAATSGTGGAVSPGTGAWLATWQSAQGWLQYIVDAVVPHATTAGFWYWVLVLYLGANITTGTYTPVVTFQYSFT